MKMLGNLALLAVSLAVFSASCAGQLSVPVDHLDYPPWPPSTDRPPTHVPRIPPPVRHPPTRPLPTYPGSSPSSDLCNPSPCNNHGYCDVYSLGSHKYYYCVCDEVWTGDNCEIQREDPCYPSPCHYHGHCSVILYGPLGEYICDCNEGWLGSQCELQDPCYPSPCHYHGHCSVNQYGPLGEYICDCNEGWSGSQCELQDPCYPSPCNNHGDCTVIQNGPLGKYICYCDQPWSGLYCEIEDKLVSCEISCTNGRCSPGSSQDTYCVCNSGYYGDYCDFKDDPSPSVGAITGGSATAVIFFLIVLAAFARLCGAARRRLRRSTQIVTSDAPPSYTSSMIYNPAAHDWYTASVGSPQHTPVPKPPAYSAVDNGYSGAAGQPTAFHNPTAGLVSASSLGQQQQGNENAYANKGYEESPPPPYDWAPSTAPSEHTYQAISEYAASRPASRSTTATANESHVA